MTRLAIVEVPDDTPESSWLARGRVLGWASVHPGRRYGYVSDRRAFEAWVDEVYRPALSGCCGQVDRAFERNVCDSFAATGLWIRPDTDAAIETRGLSLGVDAPTIHVVTTDAPIPTWTSPLIEVTA